MTRATAADVCTALDRRHQPPEWYVAREFGLGTGQRRCDYVAFNVWESRGLSIHGYEVKVEKRDLEAELREPAKAEPLFQRCHYWSLALGSRALADIAADRAPEGWGIAYLSDKGRLMNLRKPALMQAARDTMPRAEAAAWLRRALDDQAAIRRRAYDEGWKAAPDSADRAMKADLERARKQAQEAAAAVLKIEKALGVRLSSDWQVEAETERLLRATRLLRKLGSVGALEQRLRSLALDVERLAESAREAASMIGQEDAAR